MLALPSSKLVNLKWVSEIFMGSLDNMELIGKGVLLCNAELICSQTSM